MSEISKRRGLECNPTSLRRTYVEHDRAAGSQIIAAQIVEIHSLLERTRINQ